MDFCCQNMREAKFVMQNADFMDHSTNHLLICQLETSVFTADYFIKEGIEKLNDHCACHLLVYVATN